MYTPNEGIVDGALCGNLEEDYCERSFNTRIDYSKVKRKRKRIRFTN